MPDLSQGEPAEIWNQYLSQHRPAPHLLASWVTKLQEEKQYRQVIGCLQAALSHGQAQPWMYEVLALAMDVEKYPKDQVERVVLSLSDFSGADFQSMMFSGAYLTRLGRKATALKLYRQASRLLPERPEPYVLGLKLARDLKGDSDAVEWAATGVLINSWGADHEKQHRDAENALREEIRLARQKGDATSARRLEESLALAKRRDLTIRVEWNGAADLDLQVEEPTGSVCSVQSPQTSTGGVFLHDGVGPDAKDAYELYVCPRGLAGPYRITVKNAGGQLVSGRATVTATLLEGTPSQSRVVRTLVLDSEGIAALTIDLPQGRRDALRPLPTP